nr:hypothetical protein CFP56_37055 [Quercus suber]
MWGGNEDDGTLAWDAPGATRMDLTEEEVDDDGEDPEKDVVDEAFGASPALGFAFGGVRGHGCWSMGRTRMSGSRSVGFQPDRELTGALGIHAIDMNKHKAHGSSDRTWKHILPQSHRLAYTSTFYFGEHHDNDDISTCISTGVSRLARVDMIPETTISCRASPATTKTFLHPYDIHRESHDRKTD